MKNNNEKQVHVTYETDNIEKARIVANNYQNISVEYHNPNAKISPVLIEKINGHNYTKWNPKYVEYLKREHPGITDEEISNCMKLVIAELELTKNDKVESFKNSIRTR